MDNLPLEPHHSPSVETAKEAPSARESWARIRSILARELSEQSYKTWFQPVEIIEVKENEVVLGVPDGYFGNWLKNHYQDLLVSATEEILGRRVEIVYSVVEKPEDPAPPLVRFSAPPPAVGKGELAYSLNRNYTFDNFVIGPGNRFAHAAALAVTEAPAKQYNPFFIYGSVGLGKTHLMQAMAHEMQQRNPLFRILYISSEKFTNQLIHAIQTRSTAPFRAKYRTLDLLLIDDIPFIAEKESTQEEFFHTFNTLFDAHKQIVVSSNRPPKEIPGLEERLVSRFGWGLVTDIQPPDFETRVAILKKKIEREAVSVPDDVLFFIATKIKSNIRELEGALIRVVAYSSLTRHPLSLKLAQEVLTASFKEEEQNISIDKIQKVVAEYFTLRVSDLRSKRRHRSVAHPRQIAMYLVRTLTTHSFPEIGEYFGGRDHTTVLHAFHKIHKVVNKDGRTRRLLDELEEMVKKTG